jgi:drug/metabolite transporter (DMT)-like permease
MRKLMLLIGVILLLAGVIAEGMYVITNRVAYSGIVADAYLTAGILFILIGFILLLASVKIPKLRLH